MKKRMLFLAIMLLGTTMQATTVKKVARMLQGFVDQSCGLYGDQEEDVKVGKRILGFIEDFLFRSKNSSGLYKNLASILVKKNRYDGDIDDLIRELGFLINLTDEIKGYDFVKNFLDRVKDELKRKMDIEVACEVSREELEDSSHGNFFLLDKSQSEGFYYKGDICRGGNEKTKAPKKKSRKSCFIQ